MRSQKRTFTLLGGAALTGLLIFGLVRSLHPTPSPLAHAQAIVRTDQWLPETGMPGGFPLYYWSAGNALTYIATGKDGTPHLFQQPLTAEGGTPGKEGPSVYLHGGYAGQLSPDGKWFVEWHQNKLQQRVPTFVALDGSVRRIGEPTWGMEGHWSSDSDTMFCSEWRNNAALDLYHPASGPMQKITLSGLSRFDTPQCVDSNGRLIGFERGNFIMHIANSPRIGSINYPLLSMARVDPTHPDAKPEQWKVAVPKNVNNGTCVLSPAGDRILWVFYGDTTPFLMQQLKRFIPGISKQPKMGYLWLVSGVHGEDMHEVAAYTIPPGRPRTPVPAPYSHPRWMPDSKHISFISHNTLYTLPID